MLLRVLVIDDERNIRVTLPALVQSFGHQAQAAAGHHMGGGVLEVPPAEKNLPLARTQQPHQTANGGRLAHAIAPQQGGDLVRADGEGQVEQHLAGAVVAGREMAHLQEGGGFSAFLDDGRGLAHRSPPR
jgi:hypothetical protein